jgi:hypothetical protein
MPVLVTEEAGASVAAGEGALANPSTAGMATREGERNGEDDGNDDDMPLYPDSDEMQDEADPADEYVDYYRAGMDYIEGGGDWEEGSDAEAYEGDDLGDEGDDEGAVAAMVAHALIGTHVGPPDAPADATNATGTSPVMHRVQHDAPPTPAPDPFESLAATAGEKEEWQRLFEPGTVFRGEICIPGNDATAPYSLEVGVVLHCCYTVVTLLSHSCYTLVTLLLRCCYTIVTPLLHCCYTGGGLG